MSEFMEELYTNELTASEYGEIVNYCCEQLDRLGYHVETPWGIEEDETSRIMEEDRD